MVKKKRFGSREEWQPPQKLAGSGQASPRDVDIADIAKSVLSQVRRAEMTIAESGAQPDIMGQERQGLSDQGSKNSILEPVELPLPQTAIWSSGSVEQGLSQAAVWDESLEQPYQDVDLQQINSELQNWDTDLGVGFSLNSDDGLPPLPLGGPTEKKAARAKARGPLFNGPIPFVALFAVALGLFVFAGVKMILMVTDYVNTRDYWDGVGYGVVQEVVVIEGTSQSFTISGEDPGEQSGNKSKSNPIVVEKPLERSINWNSLLSRNTDVKGWIYLPNSRVNYPILQSTDNNYYLKQTLDKKWHRAGSIFMDYRNSADYRDSHSIVYGHNMTDESMFGGLRRYRNQSAYYGTHDKFYIYTLDNKILTYTIFSYYVANIYGPSYTIRFNSDAEFDSWITEIKRLSLRSIDKTPTAADKDRIFTLSTCASSDMDYRFVVHGVLTDINNVSAR